jgi:phosphate transport system substrate-binding protein
MNKKLLGVLIAVLLLAIIFSGCNEDTSKKEKEQGETIYENLTLKDLNITADGFPKIGGSTSAHPLAVLVGCKVLNISYIWSNEIIYPYQHVKIVGKNLTYIPVSNITYQNLHIYPGWGYYDIENYLIPNASETGKEYIAENITNKVFRSGTHGSYVNLINGSFDLIIVARLPSDDELELAKNYSVDLVAKPVALDAFVFILNVNNPIENLTIEQIKAIYTGEIKNWSDAGGEASKINAYQREDNSGSQELMKSLVMKDLEMIEEENMIAYTMDGPFNRLSNDRFGIAYTVYYYKQFMATHYYGSVKYCGINNIYPNYETIYSKVYPYTAEVYVVIRKDLNPESNAYKLRDWLLGTDGQDVVKESGYVPILE